MYILYVFIIIYIYIRSALISNHSGEVATSRACESLTLFACSDQSASPTWSVDRDCFSRLQVSQGTVAFSGNCIPFWFTSFLSTFAYLHDFPDGEEVFTLHILSHCFIISSSKVLCFGSWLSTCYTVALFAWQPILQAPTCFHHWDGFTNNTGHTVWITY